MKNIALFLLITCSLGCLAADPKFPVSAIPESLKGKNYGVIREQILDQKIISRSRLSVYSKEVITILNPNGKRLRYKSVHYDKLTKITSVRATIYDADGNVVKRIKASDMYDHSEYDASTLYSDIRFKSVDLNHHTYPYTIEFEYEQENKFLYDLHDFELYDDDEVSIQKSSYAVAYPPNLAPRYKLFEIGEPKKTVENGLEKLTWNFENVQPPRWERSFSRGLVPRILVAPVDFEYDGYVGRMDSWENMARWKMQLLKGRDELPEATKQKVLQMTNGKSDYEKIRTLYKYLQGRTRYVNISLGIGGLQPLEAKLVDEVGYGDCKALSNYMIALLKIVGIKGYYVSVHAGETPRDVITDFPSHQSNHIIVAVPHQRDTIWLECTSQTVPFNYLGTFTQDRYVLINTETGGKLVRTPKYDRNTNMMTRKAVVTLGPDGKGVADINTKYFAARYDDQDVGHMCNLSADYQKKWLQQNTQIGAFDILAYTFKDLMETDNHANVQVKLKLPNAATVNGKRIFMTPNLMNRSTFLPERLDQRRTPIDIRFPYMDIDSIEYNIPEEIYPEYLPEPVKISSKFGDYESSFAISSGKLIYVRKMSMSAGKYPPDTYTELSDFMKAIQKADNTKIVFLNKT